MPRSAFDQKRTSPLRVVVQAIRAGFLLYAVAVLLAIAWAWCIDVTNLDSNFEHLAPDLLLFFLSLPSSLTLPAATERWPELIGANRYGQLAWMTVCGALQVLTAAMLEAVVRRATHRWRAQHDKAASAPG